MTDKEKFIKVFGEEPQRQYATKSWWEQEYVPYESEVKILDKIRAEIEELDRYYDNDYFSANNCPMYKCDEVLQIIDKYKAEKE